MYTVQYGKCAICRLMTADIWLPNFCFQLLVRVKVSHDWAWERSRVKVKTEDYAHWEKVILDGYNVWYVWRGLGFRCCHDQHRIYLIKINCQYFSINFCSCPVVVLSFHSIRFDSILLEKQIFAALLFKSIYLKVLPFANIMLLQRQYFLLDYFKTL